MAELSGGGAEVDLLIEARGRLVPIEIKLGALPAVGRGLIECMKDLDLPPGFVVHGSDESDPTRANVLVLSVRTLADLVGLHEALFGARAPRPHSRSRER